MAFQETYPGPFEVKDCSLVAIATGEKARNISELRDRLAKSDLGSIYYHFWGGSLRPTFDDPQFHNDFAIWSHYSLHDDTLAERLAVVDPTDFFTLELLREGLIEILEQRLEEVEPWVWVPPDQSFHFIRSQIVVFDTNKRIQRPEELPDVVPGLPVGSIFYHFIDARRRNPELMDDFRAWLAGFGDSYKDLSLALASVDPYFVTLKELRGQLTQLLGHYFMKVTP